MAMINDQPATTDIPLPCTSTRKIRHPPISTMVTRALAAMKKKGRSTGSSRQAIEKFVAAEYKTNTPTVIRDIKKYIKMAVASGCLVQTKGNGACGSFKLPSSRSAKKKVSAATKKAKKRVQRNRRAASKAKKAPGRKSAAAP